MGRPKTIREGAPRFLAVLREFVPAVLRERRLAMGALAALLASTILRVLEPWPIKFVLDLIAHDGPTPDPAAPWLADLQPSTLILAAAVGVVVLTSLRAFCDYLKTVGFALVSNRVMGRLRGELYRHLQRLSLSFHDQARSGDLLVRVTGDVKMLGDVTVTALLPLVASLSLLMAMLAVMFYLNWRLAIACVAVLPLSGLATARIGGRIHAAARKQREREGRMAASAAQAISSVKVVQALALESIFEKEFAGSSRQDLQEGVKGQRLAARLERSMDVLTAMATALVIWTGGNMVLRAQLTVGELWLFYTYVKRALQPLQDFAKYAARLAKAVAAGERIIDVMHRTPDVCDLPGAQPAPRLQGQVEFRNVDFKYTPERPLFQGLNLAIEAGKRVALVGGSGSGKSTLISLLLRLYETQAGGVAIDGRDIREFTLESLRGQLGVVLQDTVLFAATVEENIALGLPDATREQIESAARLANAHSFILGLPQRYATPLGERGVNLSHGQRQRIAIARAAIRQSPILLLDEPTTGLDQRSEHLVSEALDRLSQGRTTLLATHDLRRAASADEIVMLDHGRIVEQGTHAALMQADGMYASMYGLQTRSLATLKGGEYANVG